MQNTLTDLNNHLFEQMERLNDEDLSEEELKKEVSRTKAMTTVASNIIDNAALMLDAAKHTTEYRKTDIPKVIGVGNNDK